MKKRMRMIAKQPRTKMVSLLVLLLICIGIAGFTFSSAVDNRNTKDEPIGNDNTTTLDNTIDERQISESEDYFLRDNWPSYSSEEEKEAALYNFLKDILSLQIEKIAGISDCEIDITESNSGLREADVYITVNNSFDDALETDIQANVAQALNIPDENVKISYKK